MTPLNAIGVSLAAALLVGQAVAAPKAKDPPGIVTGTPHGSSNSNWFPDFGHFTFEVMGPDGPLARVIDDGSVECHDYGKPVTGDEAAVMMWKALCLGGPRTWINEPPRKPEECRADASGLIICGEKW